MPRWKALPEGLDPQVREFANQLRRLVDRSGLSVAAVADRTGYSKTSWDRYLNGRLLAPKGAVVALSEVTGTNPVHLTTMWELAERAWSRSEMRHDMTMEAIRISQARAALGEFGQPAAKNGRARKQSSAAPPSRGGASGPGAVSDRAARPGASGPSRTSEAPRAARPARPANNDALDMTTNLSTGLAKPRPGQGQSPDSGAARTGSAAGAGAGARSTGRPEHERDYANDFERGFSQGQSYNSSGAAPGRSGAGGAGGGHQRPSAPESPRPSHQPPPNSAPDRQRQRRKLTMFLAGVVGALLVIVAAVLLTSGDDKDKDPTAGKTPVATQKPSTPKLPAGVKCSGAACEGKDPEAMGCGGGFATTSARGASGATNIEVRYSKTCGAAWARITGAASGDKVTVSSDTSAAGQKGLVKDTDAYTPMVAAATADEAKACATLAAGKKVCTVAD
ncbi:DUF2690 domain-containing protein [Streptomyces sp. NPDC058657]|uniref:helix-turn-helix domain-containing protein n=1 Tax=unclassified Streptomyces TaxID=2593676 RepID=UPI0036523136